MKTKALFVPVLSLSIASLFAFMAAPTSTAAPENSSDPSASTRGIEAAPVALVSAARDAGVDGVNARAESHDGYMMISDNHSWVIGSDDSSSSSGASARSADFDAGICTGKFHNPQIIKNRLEWGAQSSCKSTAAPNDLYRHSIHVDLRQGNPKITSFGIMHKVSEYTSLNGPYSRVATAVATNPCKKNTKANYDVVARVTVHSVQFRAVVSKTMTNLSCNVAP